MLVDFFLVFADTMDTSMDTFQFLAVRTNSSTGSTLMLTLVFHHPELQASTKKTYQFIWQLQNEKFGSSRYEIMKNPIAKLNIFFIHVLQPTRLMSS